MSGGNRCDCCCVCGTFCSGGLCGRDFNFNGTLGGATNGSCGSCSSLDAAMSFSFDQSYSASEWNSGFKPITAAFDAKAGTRVCRWASLDTPLACAASAYIDGGFLHIYYGTDDKWHAVTDLNYIEGSAYTLGGDAEFAGGGAPMDCDAFSLSIAVAVTSGTPTVCNPPTSILIENAP